MSKDEATLRELSHDLRSALAATAAHLDLARERLEEGEVVREQDLVPVEQGLQKVEDILTRLERVAREVEA